MQNFDLLHAIVQRHEPTLQTRWIKKTKPQRLKILLRAWPNMPATHRPDLEVLRKEVEEQEEGDTRYREAYVWPDVNQEDLDRPWTLLLFFNARDRNHLSRFTAADDEAIYTGFATRVLVPDFLDSWTRTWLR